MNNEREKSEAYYTRMSAEMDKLSAEIGSAAKAAVDTAEVRREAERAKAAGVKAMGEMRDRELARISEETEVERRKSLELLAEMNRSKAAILDWENESAAQRSLQASVAQDLMRDAGASVALLRRLSASDPSDIVFAADVNAVIGSYNHAAAAMSSGAYEAVVTSAQTIITRSASLAIEHEERQRERDELFIALEAKLESLREELSTVRNFTFADEIYGERKEDLNLFTQGEFAELQNQIDSTLSSLRGEDADALSVTQLRNLLAKTDNEFYPQAETLIQTGQNKLMQYYERLHALQVLAAHMKENGYVPDWVAQPGNDMTQQMVIGFKEPVSGNTVSVSLDADETADDINRLAMKVFFYYEGEQSVPEEEKGAVRAGMEKALKEAGLLADLSCTGSVGREADDRSLSSQEQVRALPVERVL